MFGGRFNRLTATLIRRIRAKFFGTGYRRKIYVQEVFSFGNRDVYWLCVDWPQCCCVAWFCGCIYLHNFLLHRMGAYFARCQKHRTAHKRGGVMIGFWQIIGKYAQTEMYLIDTLKMKIKEL